MTDETRDCGCETVGADHYSDLCKYPALLAELHDSRERQLELAEMLREATAERDECLVELESLKLSLGKSTVKKDALRARVKLSAASFKKDLEKLHANIKEQAAEIERLKGGK